MRRTGEIHPPDVRIGSNELFVNELPRRDRETDTLQCLDRAVALVNVDELDINPPGGSKFRPPDWKTRAELLEQFEASLQKGREVLRKTTDEHLFNTKWRMLSGGKLMMEQTRYEAIREGVLNHMAHHRGQLTVYLRLNGAKVPAIYGPSADEGKG